MRFCAILIVCLTSACTTVRFNERERLQQFDMQFDPDPLQATVESHVHNPRQGSAGVFSSGGGGGCGCY
ncbi:MAG: DUF4266 domain-containing protein [Gammaproteobacteria bacterium]|nr:DUF4266 domain-containing protein [Gammaproteobacteria bacterium]